MPVHLSPDIRSGVIRYWLNGYSRDEIASKFNISKGAVTNIVNEWRNNIGSLIADDLRELSLSLKKAQISSLECATGLRIGKMMQKFGINEEQFEYFMTEIYNKCQTLEIAPEQIGEYLSETINLSKIVSPSQIPNYINTKKTEIEQLEKQIEKRHEIISELNNKISILEEKQKILIANNNISQDAIRWFKDIKKEFTNMGIQVEEVSAFIECLRQIRNEGYNVNKLVTKFSQLQSFDKIIEEQERRKQENWKEMERLKNDKENLENQIYFAHLKMSKNQELQNIGMGFKELKKIYQTIIEISKANDINPKEAIKTFFDDLNKYDDVISFKQNVEDLKKEVINLKTQIDNNRTILSSQQDIGPILHDLLRKGILEEDIIDINFILLLGETDYYNNNIFINKQSLISDLKNCRNLKLSINSLEQKQIQLTNNIKELENKKIVLESYTNYLFLLLSNLKEIQILQKKINIALENPKSIIVYLFYISFLKDDDKDFKKGDDF